MPFLILFQLTHCFVQKLPDWCLNILYTMYEYKMKDALCARPHPSFYYLLYEVSATYEY